MADGSPDLVLTREAVLVPALRGLGHFYFEDSTFVRDLLSWVIPVLLFVGVWIYLGRRMSQGLGGGLMQIGKSKARIYVESNTGVTFDDVAGVEEAKESGA